MSDLFGRETVMTPAERKKLRAKTQPRGHSAPPGTGPEGETCKTCAHLVRREFAKTYLKCGLSRWTGGTATDVRARDAACRNWTKGGDA